MEEKTDISFNWKNISIVVASVAVVVVFFIFIGSIKLPSSSENKNYEALNFDEVDVSEFEAVYLLKEGELFIAFHKSTPDSLIEKYQAALDKVKAGPKYQQILDKYLK